MTKSTVESKYEENKDPIIIKSRLTDKPITRYIFRGYRYIVAEVKFSINSSLADIYFNTDYIISLIDR